jgi:hypothetical protein
MHLGHAPKNVTMSEVRMTLGQLLQSEPRPVGTVLLDAIHSADAILQDAKAKVSVDGDVSVVEMSRFIEALERAAKLAKVAVDAGVATKLVEIRELEITQHSRRISDILLGTIDALGLNDRDRGYALTVMRSLVSGDAIPPRPIESTPAAVGPSPADYVVVPSPADAIRNADVRLLGTDVGQDVGDRT